MKIKNKFNGYQNFSKYVLQKHANKINDMKTGVMDSYSNKVKYNMTVFSREIDTLLGNI